MKQLRLIRDAVLSREPEGQEIIALYYKRSPLLLRAIASDKGFKGKARYVIDEFLRSVGMKATQTAAI